MINKNKKINIYEVNFILFNKLLNNKLKEIEIDLNKYKVTNEFIEYLKGEINYKNGKINEGIENFKKCYFYNPMNEEYLKKACKGFILLKKFSLAEKIISKIDKIKDPEVVILKKIIYSKKGNFEKILYLLDEHKFLSFKIKVELCLILKKIQNFEDYNVILNDLLNEYPLNKNILKLKLNDLLESKQYNEAFHYLGILISMNDEDSFNEELGLLLNENNDYNSSIYHYKKTLYKNPLNFNVWNNMGNVYLKNNDYNKALLYFQKANYLNTTYHEIHYNLGLTFLKLKRFSSALIHLNSANLLNKNSDSMYNLLLGICYEKLNYNEKALEHIEKSFNLNNSTIYLTNYWLILSKMPENHKELSKIYNKNKDKLIDLPEEYNSKLNYIINLIK